MFKLFTNKVYSRLERIYTYAKTFYAYTEQYTGTGKEYTVEFNSELGNVQIIISHADSISQSVGCWEYELEYANYAGSTVFKVFADRYRFDVTPYLDDKLGGHNVDLAIYELEQFLEKEFGKVEDALKKQKQDLEKKRTRHKQELQILEYGI